MSGIKFSIRDWAVWMPAAEEAACFGQRVEAPALGLIPPMMRRRLGEQGKMAISACAALLEPQPVMPLVFCSRHGEIQRSIEILTALHNGETPSPMQFSLSVHNAISGMLSISTGNTSNISAIAAGPDGIANAIAETAMVLNDADSDTALCVIYDQPLPAIYGDTELEPEHEYALALLLEKSAPPQYQLNFGRAADEQPAVSLSAQLNAMFALLSGQADSAQLGQVRLQRCDFSEDGIRPQ
ncbi:beta-ketoacyl synthase chain length factor [Oceanobacter mangrovi]|uniref:beta-ketoacyl synthase chain length factor n=1 Tax=Oceanobacter mangrovi TaxID=2862510 RepID=UPI001C8D2D68|nr:beta-ketoacyl synthase chain length factor [Oceanobacter mangrovi]